MAKNDFDFDDYDSYDDETDYYDEPDYELYDGVKWYNPFSWFKWIFSRLMIHWDYISGNIRPMIRHLFIEFLIISVAAWVTILQPGEIRGWIFIISLVTSWFLVVDMAIILALFILKRSGRA